MDGKYLLTVSSDKVNNLYKTIVLCDGLTGEKILSKDAHDMGVMKCDWFENNHFVTCSSD